MQGINNPSRLAPRNPTAKELNLLMEGKHRELRGFLCCENDHKINDWHEISNNKNIRIQTILLLNIGTFLVRRADFIIQAPMEKVAQIATDLQTYYKIMKDVENV